MDHGFARRIDELKASDIREILKLTQRPEVISFAGGLPAPEHFPTNEIAEVASTVLREQGTRALQYSPTEGFPPLREQIARRMNVHWRTHVRSDQILITTGSQQGLDLIGKLFLDDGDEVLVENPTYLGAIGAWKVFRPRWIEVSTDDDGMIPEALEQGLRRCTRPKLIYVVPNFQNPTGRTWSLERRRALVELAARYHLPIVEDNPYGEVRFEGESIPSIKSIERDNEVIALGTFSKTFCPGMRIAWVGAASPYFEKFVILKQGADLHSSTLDQMIAAAYMERYDLDANIARVTACYRKRCGAMIAALERELPPGVSFTRPAGGLFLWVELPESLNARDLLVRCLERHVAFVPGGSFYPNGGHENTLRLNFSCMPEERIVEGVERLAAAIRDCLPASQRSRA